MKEGSKEGRKKTIKRLPALGQHRAIPLTSGLQSQPCPGAPRRTKSVTNFTSPLSLPRRGWQDLGAPLALLLTDSATSRCRGCRLSGFTQVLSTWALHWLRGRGYEINLPKRHTQWMLAKKQETKFPLKNFFSLAFFFV